MLKRYWTNEEVEFLKDNYYEMNTREIAEKLNRTMKSIQIKAFRLNLEKKVKYQNQFNRWTEEEDDFLRENWNKIMTKDIAEYLNRSINAVQLRAERSGLEKKRAELRFSKEYLEEFSRKRKGSGGPFYGKKHTEETKAKMSGIYNSQYGKKPSFYRREWKERGEKVLGYPVRSSWEFNFCKFLQDELILYFYELRTFEMVIDGKKCTYTPDIYIPRYDIWVEIKGYMSELEQKKIDYFRKNYDDIIVIDGKDYNKFKERFLDDENS